MVWHYLSILNLQQCSQWDFRLGKYFHHTLWWVCGNVSMLGFKFICVNKKGHDWLFGVAKLFSIFYSILQSYVFFLNIYFILIYFVMLFSYIVFYNYDKLANKTFFEYHFSTCVKFLVCQKDIFIMKILLIWHINRRLIWIDCDQLKLLTYSFN